MDCALTLNDCCSVAGIKVQEKDFVSRGPRDPALTALDQAAQPTKKEISISNTGTWEFVYTDEVRMFIGCESTSPFLPEALAEFFFCISTLFFHTVEVTTFIMQLPPRCFCCVYVPCLFASQEEDTCTIPQFYFSSLVGKSLAPRYKGSCVFYLKSKVLCVHS